MYATLNLTDFIITAMPHNPIQAYLCSILIGSLKFQYSQMSCLSQVRSADGLTQQTQEIAIWVMAEVKEACPKGIMRNV